MLVINTGSRMVYRILVGSYTTEIYTLAFDPEVPSLTLTSTITLGYHPSWITPHPTDKTIVFTALEQSEGKIFVLKLDDEGRATAVGEGPSGGADPCTLLALEGQLLLGNVRTSYVCMGHIIRLISTIASTLPGPSLWYF